MLKCNVSGWHYKIAPAAHTKNIHTGLGVTTIATFTPHWKLHFNTVLSLLLPRPHRKVYTTGVDPRLSRRLEEYRPGRPITKNVIPTLHIFPTAYYEMTCQPKERERTIPAKPIGGIHCWNRGNMPTHNTGNTAASE